MGGMLHRFAQDFFKELGMSETPMPTAGADTPPALPASSPPVQAPLIAATQVQAPLIAAGPSVSDVAPAVIQTVAAHPGVPAEHAASVAYDILAAMAPFLQPALQVSRASTRTSTEVQLGFGLVAAILGMLGGRVQSNG